MKWYFSKDDCLHIAGTGMVQDYFEGKNAEPPWQMWKNRIRFLYVEEGITDLGAFLFKDWPRLQQVYLPESLKRIRIGCFSGCKKLRDVITPNDTEYVSLYHYMDELRKDPQFDKKDGTHVVVFDSNAFYDTPWALEKWGPLYIKNDTLYTSLHRDKCMVLPENMKAIAPFAFYGPEVEQVILPINPELKVHEDAFSGSCIHYSKQMSKRLPEAFALVLEEGGKEYPGMKRFCVRAKKPYWHYGPRGYEGNVRKEYRGIVGTDAVNGAYYLTREAKKGKVAVGILFRSDSKVVSEVQSIRWSDWNRDYRCYYETPYYEDGLYSVRLKGRNAMIFGKDYEELEYEFYSSPVMGILTDGYDVVRYGDENLHEEWFLAEEEEFDYGEVETDLLNIWMKNHPEYRLTEEK